MNRSIWLATAAPEILLSTFPKHRVLNDVYIYFSSWADTLDSSLVYDSTDLSIADEEGNTMPLEDLLDAVGGLINAGYDGEIRITNSQAQVLQALPHWALFLGEYGEKTEAALQKEVTRSKLPALDFSKSLKTLTSGAEAFNTSIKQVTEFNTKVRL